MNSKNRTIPPTTHIIWSQLIILNWTLAVTSCIRMTTLLPHQSLKTKFPLPHFYWQSLHFIWCSQALGNLLNCQLGSFPTTTHSFSPAQEKSSECRFADMLHSHALPGEYILEAFWNSTMSFHYRASQNSTMVNWRIVCYFFSPWRKENCLSIHSFTKALETLWEWETSRLKQLDRYLADILKIQLLARWS